MKSICIKTNNTKSIKYLLEKINNSKSNSIYFSLRNFKIYQNIIIHFKKEDEKSILKEISSILANLVIDVFEETIIKNIISEEYFYFNETEKREILSNTIDDLRDDNECIYPQEEIFTLLYNDFFSYLSTNKSIVLKGFITFRIKNYLEILADQIDKSVNKLIIGREYTEFISLLKM